MEHPPKFYIVMLASGIGWPHGHCAVRGDLGCLANHAKAIGYRADGLAERLGVAPRILRRAFHDAFGIALKNWLAQVRAVEVRHRLRGSESIKEIALSVGFSHAKELSREFHKIYEVTPTEFRRRVRRVSPELGDS
jgi:AraC-like DNA-binding protein